MSRAERKELEKQRKEKAKQKANPGELPEGEEGDAALEVNTNRGGKFGKLSDIGSAPPSRKERYVVVANVFP